MAMSCHPMLVVERHSLSIHTRYVSLPSTGAGARPRAPGAILVPVDDPRQHAGEHRVRFDECGADGTMRPSALLRAVQDLAWQTQHRGRVLP